MASSTRIGIGLLRIPEKRRSVGGAAWLVLGPFDQYGRHSIDLRSSVRFEGAPGDQAGCAVAGLGDFGGVGLDTVAVGICRADLGDETNAGAVALVELDGGASGRVHTLGVDDAMVYGAAGERLGLEVEAAHDLDGDGYDDLLAGSHCCGLDFAPSEDCFQVPAEGPWYGHATWNVLRGRRGPVLGASVAVASVAALRVEIEANHTACDSAVVGSFLGDPAQQDLAIGVCTDRLLEGAVVLLADPNLDGQTLRLPDDADEILEVPGGEAGSLSGAELEIVGDTLLVGAWKADTADGVDAGAVYVLPAEAFR